MVLGHLLVIKVDLPEFANLGHKRGCPRWFDQEVESKRQPEWSKSKQMVGVADDLTQMVGQNQDWIVLWPNLENARRIRP